MYEKFLKLGLDYIEQKLFLDISLEECAKAAGYFLYHYCRVFNAAIGITVKEYIRKRRVSEAVKMINETSLSLKEIAYRCGFNSQENFIRVSSQYLALFQTITRKPGIPFFYMPPIVYRKKFYRNLTMPYSRNLRSCT